MLSIRRRDFVTLLGGAAAWPLAARAQQGNRVRRIGVLMSGVATNSRLQSYSTAFMQALRQLGWIEGRNVRIDVRWSAGDADLARTYVAQLIGLMPDVILSFTTTNLKVVREATSTLPVVFVALGVEVTVAEVRKTGDIEPAIASLARQPNGGLILPTDTFMDLRNPLIVELALRHRLPTIGAQSAEFAKAGGLMYYGPATTSTPEQMWQAAGYVDRILKGEKPGDLPVQLVTKFELVINLKTATALGLDVPPVLRAIATEVVE
jgi:ABC-type uncharacterized transport system substrate-binding protein